MIFYLIELLVVILCMYFGGWCRMLFINLILLKLGKEKYISLKVENYNIYRENIYKNEILLCNEVVYLIYCLRCLENEISYWILEWIYDIIIFYLNYRESFELIL